VGLRPSSRQIRRATTAGALLGGEDGSITGPVGSCRRVIGKIRAGREPGACGCQRVRSRL